MLHYKTSRFLVISSQNLLLYFNVHQRSWWYHTKHYLVNTIFLIYYNIKSKRFFFKFFWPNTEFYSLMSCALIGKSSLELGNQTNKENDWYPTVCKNLSMILVHNIKYQQHWNYSAKFNLVFILSCGNKTLSFYRWMVPTVASEVTHYLFG